MTMTGRKLPDRYAGTVLPAGNSNWPGQFFPTGADLAIFIAVGVLITAVAALFVVRESRRFHPRRESYDRQAGTTLPPSGEG